MKKLLTFLIMLVVGAALFAMPVVPSEEIAVEAVQQVGVFTVVTDVSPVLAEYSPYNDFEVAFSAVIQEVIPFYGYSKTAGQKMNIAAMRTFEGWS